MFDNNQSGFSSCITGRAERVPPKMACSHAILRGLSTPATVRKAAFWRPEEQALAKQLAPLAARRRRAANV